MKIYKGCENIQILGEANGPDKSDQFKYERRCEETLDEIGRTRTGQILLGEIRGLKKSITLMPGREHAGVFGTMESFRESVVDTGRSAYDAQRARTRTGAAVQYQDSEAPIGTCRVETLMENGKPVIGNGRGNDTIIQFIPWAFTDSTTVSASVALFHELIHAMREMKGTMDRKPTCDDYDTSEEFIAIFFENMHRSEWRKLGKQMILRYHHHGIKELPLYLQNPATYFQAYRGQIMQIRGDMYWITEQFYKLADLAFNPLRFAPR